MNAIERAYGNAKVVAFSDTEKATTDVSTTAAAQAAGLSESSRGRLRSPLEWATNAQEVLVQGPVTLLPFGIVLQKGSLPYATLCELCGPTIPKHKLTRYAAVCAQNAITSLGQCSLENMLNTAVVGTPPTGLLAGAPPAGLGHHSDPSSTVNCCSDSTKIHT